jgi:hypothetical protein
VNFLPQALAWLEESAKSWSQSSQKVYARALLDEIKRLSDAATLHSREIEKREKLRKESRDEHLALGRKFGALKEELERERLEAETTRVGLEGRLTAEQEKRTIAENLLRDIHYGLLKQPELTREDLASAITSVVTPYPEGAKP